MVFVSHTNDVTGLSGRLGTMTPPTMRWYSIVMENYLNRVESRRAEYGRYEWKRAIRELNGTVGDNPRGQLKVYCTSKYSKYRGDALSMLLFCISLNPLSQIIRKTGSGY